MARDSLTTFARAGYDGNENPHLATSAAWYAHALGRFLHDSGRSVPEDVRMSRGDSIRSRDCVYAFSVFSAASGGTRISFERKT